MTQSREFLERAEGEWTGSSNGEQEGTYRSYVEGYGRESSSKRATEKASSSGEPSFHLSLKEVEESFRNEV